MLGGLNGIRSNWTNSGESMWPLKRSASVRDSLPNSVDRCRIEIVCVCVVQLIRLQCPLIWDTSRLWLYEPQSYDTVLCSYTRFMQGQHFFHCLPKLEICLSCCLNKKRNSERLILFSDIDWKVNFSEPHCRPWSDSWLNDKYIIGQ